MSPWAAEGPEVCSVAAVAQPRQQAAAQRGRETDCSGGGWVTVPVRLTE